MWDIGQAPRRGRKANTPHRRPPSFVRWRRCGPFVVHAPRRNPRLSDGQNLGGEMGSYQWDLVYGANGELINSSGMSSQGW